MGRRGRKPSEKFAEHGKKITLSMNEPNILWLKEVAKEQKVPYSWVLDDIVTALREEDQKLLDQTLIAS